MFFFWISKIISLGLFLYPNMPLFLHRFFKNNLVFLDFFFFKIVSTFPTQDQPTKVFSEKNVGIQCEY